jgi:hypothetical protein
MGGILVALAAVNDYTGWEARIRLATQGIPHARVYTCGMIAVLTAPVCGGRSQAWYLLLANGWLSGKRKGISLALQIAGEDFGTSPAPESQRKAKTNAYTTLVVSEVGMPCTTSNTPSAAICPVAFGFMTEPVCRVPPLGALMIQVQEPELPPVPGSGPPGSEPPHPGRYGLVVQSSSCCLSL